MKRKIATWILLFLLLVVPFFNWRLGALFWLCAWIIFITQGLFRGKPLVVHEDEKWDSDAIKNNSRDGSDAF